MKILYLAHRIPYPPNKGDKIRSYHELQWLCRHHEVDLVAFYDREEDRQYNTELSNICKNVSLYPRMGIWRWIRTGMRWFLGESLSVNLFASADLSAKVKSLCITNQYDGIFVFSSQMCQFIKKDFSKTVIDFCDVDSHKWENYADKMPLYLSWFYRLESRRLLAFEKRYSLAAKASLFITTEEKALFESLGGKGNIHELGNGVNSVRFRPPVSESKKAVKSDWVAAEDSQDTDRKSPWIRGRILFTGAMDYFPNEDAVLWFADRVMPLLRTKIEGIRFVIAGSNPTDRVQALASHEDIEVTGFVPDMLDELHKAHIVVAPLRIARGLQNKVLEALSCAKAIVVTPDALVGISAKHDEEIMVAQDAQEFCRRIVELFGDDQKVLTLGEKARQLVLTRYQWNKILDEGLGGLFERRSISAGNVN